MYPMAEHKQVLTFFILFLNLLSLSPCQNTFHIGLPLPSLLVSREVEEEVAKLVTTNMIAIQAKSEKFLRDVIARRLTDPDTPPYSQMCMDQCEDNYVNANQDIRRVLYDMSNKNYDKACEDVDAIVTEIETCYECLNEIVGEDYELKAFDGWIAGVADHCLAHLHRLAA